MAIDATRQGSLDFYFRLTVARDYRSFLRLWMEEGGRGGRSVSFGEAARRFGFASRGFLSDLLRGRKSLSAGSLAAIRSGLGHLADGVVRTFVILVYLEEDGLRPPSMTAAKATELLTKLRPRAVRLFSDDASKLERPGLDDIVKQMAFHLCFAALQVGDLGESISVVAKKTGLPEAEARAMLDAMVRAGFVALVGGNGVAPHRYAALDGHRVIEHMASPEAFRTFIMNWTSQILRRLAAEKPRNEDLYNVTTFSVRSVDRPAFRRRLIEAIDSLVEEFEASPGDEIVSLTLMYTGHVSGVCEPGK